jgi:hypothetical protein
MNKFDESGARSVKARCSECGSWRSYTNPMARCWECKKKFCYGHVWCGQINDNMGPSDVVRNICGSCQIASNYRCLWNDI